MFMLEHKVFCIFRGFILIIQQIPTNWDFSFAQCFAQYRSIYHSLILLKIGNIL